MIKAKLDTTAELSARIIRADGSHRDAHLSTQKLDPKHLAQKLMQPLSFWSKLYTTLRHSNIIPATMTLAAFAHYLQTGDANGISFALVTTAGVNYLAADFLTSSTAHISAFNFHDSGTGTTAAAIGDTGLVTQAGPTTRATGTQSNPVAGTYRTVGTISYASSLSITEWGLFNQAAQGAGSVLWDRRVFTAIAVASGDSISFTYSVQINAGGS
jgi:hypothetical protein